MKRFALIFLSVILFAMGLTLFSCEASYTSITVRYTAGEGGIVEGSVTQTMYLYEEDRATFLSVTASPKPGYKFVSWSDGLTEEKRMDTLSQSASFEAIFELLEITVKYDSTEGGKIEGVTEQTIKYGQTTSSVTAVADEGFTFKGWSDGHPMLSRSDSADSDSTYTAIFEESDRIEICYKATQGGIITGEANQSALSVGIRFSPVTAVADEGYRFVKWDDGSLSPERHDISHSDKTVTAIFAKYHRVTFESSDTALGTVSGNLNQIITEGEYGATVTATATKNGYKFLCWSNGEKSHTINYSPTESTTVYAIFVEDFFELPVISISTVNGANIVSKDTYLDCLVRALENGEIALSNRSAKVRGRGNTSWEESDKKPYKLKFDEKTSLLGMTEAKDFTLIPNYTDKSLIRNYITYQVAKELSHLGETPDCVLCELWLNGEYRGVYLACEQIEVNGGRVEIEDDLSKTDIGYLIELDGRGDGLNFKVETTLKNNAAALGTKSERIYVIKSPDPDSPYLYSTHIAFIRDYVTSCMRALESKDYERVKSLIDVDSFAQAYIVFELFRGADVGWSSFFLHKDAGGKIECGPVWDFDRAIGNIDYNRDAYKIDNLYAKNNNEWFFGLLQFEEFKALVSKYLSEYKPIIEKTLSDAYDYAYSCSLSFNRNFEKWDILNIYVRPNCAEMVAAKTWEEQVAFVQLYVAQSLSYMCGEYGV